MLSKSTFPPNNNINNNNWDYYLTSRLSPQVKRRTTFSREIVAHAAHLNHGVRPLDHLDLVPPRPVATGGASVSHRVLLPRGDARLARLLLGLLLLPLLAAPAAAARVAVLVGRPGKKRKNRLCSKTCGVYEIVTKVGVKNELIFKKADGNLIKRAGIPPLKEFVELKSSRNWLS